MHFALEKWAVLFRDGHKKLFPEHFDELAVHKEQIPLGMDDSLYQHIEDLGRLHVLTAREAGELVGYYVAIVIPNHPHNKDAGPCSTTDMFYMARAHRKGGSGAKLLMMAEKTLRERGVTKASISVKLHQNHGPLLEALGWEHTDLVFQKVL
jgi:GNAT superfamily N-acetyltransferase